MFIDIRSFDEYTAEHIKQAINIPLERLSTDALPVNDTRPVVYYCRSGGRTANNAGTLQAHARGRNAFIIDGGIIAWKAAGFSTEM